MNEINTSILNTLDTKQIKELNSLAKLNGKEELIIDNGDSTLKITVDTLLGYIRDQINNGTSSSSSSLASTIHFISKDQQNIPASARPENHYYIRVVESSEANISTGLPKLIKVSPNMQLRMINNN